MWRKMVKYVLKKVLTKKEENEKWTLLRQNEINNMIMQNERGQNTYNKPKTLGGIPGREPPSCEAPRQPTMYEVTCFNEQ